MICRLESDHSGQGDSYNDGIRRVRPMTSWREPGAPHAGVSYPGEEWIPLGRRGVTPEQARKADALIRELQHRSKEEKARKASRKRHGQKKRTGRKTR